MTAQIQNCRSNKFAADLNTGSKILTEVNQIAVLIGHSACAAWKNSACSIGSRRHCAAELTEVDPHLSGGDSGTVCGAAHVNTTPASLAAQGIEGENSKIIFMLKSQGFILKWLFHFFGGQISGGSAWFRGYTTLYRVHHTWFRASGCVVSRVWYLVSRARVHSFEGTGYMVFHYGVCQ